MVTVTEKEKGLASLALFSQLYDEKKDIISVIIDFIEISVIHHKDRTVDHVTLNRYLKDDYGFDIPKVVVENAIRKADFLTRTPKSKVNYIVDDSKLNIDRLSCEARIEDINEEVTQVISLLRKNLIDKDFCNIESVSDSDLKRALCTFLIEEDHSSALSQQIEQFVILNPELRPILQKVIQGSIIFMGLSYNSKPLEYTVIESDLVIYLDTELLFFMAGYDGETFQGLFKEFYDVVSEINRLNYAKKGGDLIRLKYFPEIKDEINGYFSTAEAIVSGRKRLDTSRTAMSYIVRSAKNPSDVITMQADFWGLVNKFSIKEEEYEDYYLPKNKKFNIESSELLDSVLGDEIDKENNLRFLNYVNIHRGAQTQTEFKKMGYAFLTQTQVALQLSRTIRNSGQTNVPLAFTLGELTTRLWLGLNHGFNPSATLKNFDVIIKAQIALAKRTNQSVEKRYKALMESSEDYSREEVVSRIAALRLKVPTRPEEMTTDNDDILQANDLEAFIENKMCEIQQKDSLIKEKDTELNKKNLEITKLKPYKEFADSQQKEITKLKEYIRRDSLEKFNKEIFAWRKKRNRYVFYRMLYKMVMSILCVVVIIWVLICIAGAVCAFLNENRGHGGLAICIALTSLILDGVMYYSLIPGRRTLIFLFKKKEKRKYKQQLLEKYLNKHNRPVYKEVNIDV
ncbi:MAG: hypothetical protein NC324_04695 [Bacteroides sp.]|nr:hypothetical protein [Bacteroides sp.]